jgi:hypothetical protein
MTAQAATAAHVNKSNSLDNTAGPTVEHDELKGKPYTIECPTVDTSSIKHEPRNAIAATHNALTGGHRSVTATIRQLRQVGFNWSTMRQDVVTFIRACPLCQKIWLHQRLPKYHPSTIEVYEPFAVLGSDYMGPFPKDKHGNEFIHVLMCLSTRYVYLFAATGPTAENTARDLTFVMSHHGTCHTLHSDRGAAYIANVTKAYNSLLNLDHTFNIPYRSQQNSIVERTNGSISNHILALVNTDRETLHNWSDSIPIITRLLNTTFHSVLQCTQSSVVYGTHFTAARELFSPKATTEEPKSKSLRERYQKMIILQAKLLLQSEKFQAQHSDEYAQKVGPVQFSDRFAENSLVLVTYPDRPPSKFHPRLRGPFKVMERHADDTYSCMNLVNGHALHFHISQLRPYTNDINPQALSPIEVAARDHEEFMVDCIIDHRVIHKGSIKKPSHLQFLVVWLGYEEEFNTWEPYANVKDLQALSDYVHTIPQLNYLI